MKGTGGKEGDKSAVIAEGFGGEWSGICFENEWQLNGVYWDYFCPIPQP